MGYYLIPTFIMARCIVVGMEGLADYKGADEANKERHGLEVGDTLSGGMGGDVEVVEIDDEGVKFDDGSTACHNTVVRNMEQLDLL